MNLFREKGKEEGKDMEIAARNSKGIGGRRDFSEELVLYDLA